MSKIEKIIDNLNDGAHVVIDLPIGDQDTHRLNAAFQKDEGLEFELFFPPDSWNIEELQLGLNCQLTVKHKGGDVNLIAELDKVVSDRRLSFIAREPIKPEALREFFRVTTNVPIEIGYAPGPKEVKTKAWKMVGTTVDLSGSGVLGLFAGKPPSENRINISIEDPASETKILCTGDVVRTYRMRKKRFQVAMHFNAVDQVTRDRLIAFCLQEQRKQLREKIQVE